MSSNPTSTKSTDESWRKRYRRLHSELTASEQRAGAYFENHAESAYLSISEVVAKSGIGYGTLVRFCQKLGYKGFQEFKLFLAADEAITASPSDSSVGNSPLSMSKARLKNELSETLRLLDEMTLNEAAQLLLASRSVLIIGVASSAPLVLSLAWKLNRIGIDARPSTEGYVMSINATLLNEFDILFAISASGATKDILHTANLASDRGANIIALTNFSSSPLSQLANVSLFTTTSRDPLKAEVPSIIAGEAIAEMLLDRLLTLAPERRDQLLSSSKAVSDRKI